jgi:hypothetical protein
MILGDRVAAVLTASAASPRETGLGETGMLTAGLTFSAVF